ncbi:MAG: glycosyltransferase [Verrucomicrobiae bacterium]|nr:glycosyltransferase [Verrucomicrobiae bacterium]
MNDTLPTPPVISVIIAAFDEEEFICQTIESVQKSAERLRRERNVSIEIIVVDNHSKDRTNEMATACGARVVYEPENNIAKARNIGALLAQGDFLAFVDGRMIVSEDLFVGIDQNLLDPGVVGGGTREEMLIPSSREQIYVWGKKLIRFVCGGFSGIFHCRRKDFVELRGFDENLHLGEKLEFHRRLRRFGAQRNQTIRNSPTGSVMVLSRKLRTHGLIPVAKTTSRLIFNPDKKLRDRKTAWNAWYEKKK